MRTGASLNNLKVTTYLAAFTLALSALIPSGALAGERRKVIKRKPAQVIKMKPSEYPNPFVVKGWTFDAGLSRGQRQRADYYEYSVGANAYFYDWLAWRNVIYMRDNLDGTKNLGWDMSERFNYELGQDSGLSIFGAPGFRWGGSAGNGPFVEAGATFQIGRVAVGGGVRELFTSWTRTGAGNETQVFINLFAGGWP